MLIQKNDNNSINFTVDRLKKGEIVIIPTDTLYGFSGIVSSVSFNGYTTEEKILKIKGRDQSKGLIRLIANPRDIFQYTDSIVPLKFLNLWPAPLTLIVKEKNSSNTLAFRCPNDKWVRELIEKLGSAIYSTSVNYSNKAVLRKISDIRKEFEEKVDLVVSSESDNNFAYTSSQKASTIISLINDKPEILRYGALKIPSFIL